MEAYALPNTTLIPPVPTCYSKAHWLNPDLPEVRLLITRLLFLANEYQHHRFVHTTQIVTGSINLNVTFDYWPARISGNWSSHVRAAKPGEVSPLSFIAHSDPGERATERN